MRRDLHFVLVFLLLFSAVGSGGATSPDWDFEDIYLADDKDPKAEDVPRFAPMPLSIIFSSDLKIEEMAKSYDFYYLVTSPKELLQFSIGSDASMILPTVNYEAYALNKFEPTITDENASMWPTSVTPADSRFIKDAYVEAVGFRDGYKYTTNQSGTTYLVPDSGVIWTVVDYRLSAPKRTCSVTNQTKTCHKLTPTGTEVRRKFIAGGKSWADSEFDGPRGLTLYKDLPDGSTQATVKATFKTTFETKVTTYDYDQENETWVLNQTTTTTDQTRFSVTDNLTVHTQDQQLTVKQRVINRSDDENIIVLEFQGPDEIPDRRLWSYVKVTDSAVVENVWGLYSARQARYGRLRHNTGTDSRIVEYPVLPSLQLTATSPKPKVLYLGSASGQKSIYTNIRVTNVETGEFTSEKPVVPQPNVDLPSHTPPRVEAVVIRGSEASSIKSIRDLRNNKIPVETVRKEYRATNITTHRINKTAIRITLTDETGQPVPGRELHVNVPGTDTVVTNEAGQAIVRTEQRAITVRFHGDNFTENHEIYYGQSNLSTVVGLDSPFYIQLYRLVKSLKWFATGFAVAAILLLIGKTLNG